MKDIFKNIIQVREEYPIFVQSQNTTKHWRISYFCTVTKHN